MTLFRRLHFTDLHVGNDTVDRNWPNIERDLHGDLNWCVDRIGPWDFILISGDIVNTGREDEFTKASKRLNTLAQVFANYCNSQMLTVPGNHDLSRSTNDYD